jgi:hypothetical protein
MDGRGPIEQAIDLGLNAGVFTRRQYMIRKLLHQGSSFPSAVEAVTNVGRVHRDWNMEQQRTWAEWEAMLAEGQGAEDEA